MLNRTCKAYKSLSLFSRSVMLIYWGIFLGKVDDLVKTLCFEQIEHSLPFLLNRWDFGGCRGAYSPLPVAAMKVKHSAAELRRLTGGRPEDCPGRCAARRSRSTWRDSRTPPWDTDIRDRLSKLSPRSFKKPPLASDI